MAPIKMPMMMWNMTTFPIERLCFDLKLEVLEQLEAKDVIELVKVNQGLQWMISNRPAIVFGHHVQEIAFLFGEFSLGKREANEWRMSCLDVIRHFPFSKNIRSCNQLVVWHVYDSPIDKDHADFLKQLEAVNSLDLYWCSPKRLGFLSHFSIKIKRDARLPRFLPEASSIKELVGHFIETQLNECEIVEFDCTDGDEFLVYYNALIKTHIKYVKIGCCNKNLKVPAIQRIVSHGLPSQDPTAVVRICYGFIDDMMDTIVAFLEGYPGMKQINGKNCQPFVALANERLKKSRDPALMKILLFRRKIDATRDCIYILSLDDSFHPFNGWLAKEFKPTPRSGYESLLRTKRTITRCFSQGISRIETNQREKSSTIHCMDQRSLGGKKISRFDDEDSVFQKKYQCGARLHLHVVLKEGEARIEIQLHRFFRLLHQAR